MDDEKSYLLTWAKHYYKGRDSILKTIENIEDKDFGFTIHYKTKVHDVICLSDLSQYDPSGQHEGSKTLVTFNTKGNFLALLDKWDNLAQDRWLSIFFINPLSFTEKRWVIHPYNHDAVADKESMKRGLRAIYESVEEMSPEQIKKVINEQEF